MRHTNKYYYKQNANVTNAKKVGEGASIRLKRAGGHLVKIYNYWSHNEIGRKTEYDVCSKMGKRDEKKKNETKQKQINFMNTWCKKQFEKY